MSVSIRLSRKLVAESLAVCQPRFIPIFKQIPTACASRSLSSTSQVRGAFGLSEEQYTRMKHSSQWMGLQTQQLSDNGPSLTHPDQLTAKIIDKLLTEEQKKAIVADSPDERSAKALLAATHSSFLDKLLLDAVGRRIRQAILVGMGFETRPFRLDLPPQMRLIELEEASILQLRSDILASAGHRARCLKLEVALAPSVFAQGSETSILEGLRTALATDPLQTPRPSLLVLGPGLLNGAWQSVEEAALTALAEALPDGSRLFAHVYPSAVDSELALDTVLPRIQNALRSAGWSRPDVVGQKALSRLFSDTPADDKGVIVVAERGAPSQPGRVAAEPLNNKRPTEISFKHGS